MKGSKYIGRPIPSMQIINLFMVISSLVKLLIFKYRKNSYEFRSEFLKFFLNRCLKGDNSVWLFFRANRVIFIYIFAAFMKNTTFLDKIRPSYIVENVFVN